MRVKVMFRVCGLLVHRNDALAEPKIKPVRTNLLALRN